MLPILIGENKNKTPNLEFQIGVFIFRTCYFVLFTSNYIIPGIPPPIGILDDSFLMSIKAHSVVKIIPATEAAFSKATRVTFT